MPPFTLFHVLLSLIGIATGFVVMSGLLKSERLNGWTANFLFFTLATSVTGFLFPFNGFTPAIGVGIIAVIVMIATLAARYVYRMAGPWRPIYVVGAVISQYLNVFVLVVQLYLKVPALHALAPNGNEPPFAITQGIVLVLFIIAGFLAVRRFHPA
jgi:hypothetical protein